MKLNKELKYLVGVSGGPDSMYLLNYLISNEIKNIIVCHVNYNYRKDSAYDEKIVRDFCSQNSIDIEVLNIKQNYNELSENFESWAREVRYSFFCEIGSKNNVANLLLGHNLNDFIETYLMQKARSNLVSFYGIKKINKYKNLIVIRPMLDIKKSAIIEYLTSNNIAFAIDSTNSDINFARNKIRSEIDENDFSKYIEEINQANAKLESVNEEVQMYVKNNSNASELNITKHLQAADLTFIQRCIYKWLENESKVYVLQNRSNRTLNELAKTVKNSNKSFWKITLQNLILFKDYNKLKIIDAHLAKTKTYEIKNHNDLYLVEEFINWLDLYNAIMKDKNNYPYFVSNDYEWYKKITTVGNKKTNRFFIDKKITNSVRMINGVAFSKKKCKILNSIK